MAASVPPTTHELDKPQRLRLMRSHRKLTAVLGTTPLLLDPREPGLPLPTPSPTITSVLTETGTPFPERAFPTITLISAPTSDAASVVQLAHRKPKPKPQRPVLLLRVNSIPPTRARTQSLAHTRSRTMEDGWPSPSLPSPATSLSLSPPPSPVFPKDTASSEARRRKLARVTRTLGEPIPPDLVFPRSVPTGDAAVFPQKEAEWDAHSEKYARRGGADTTVSSRASTSSGRPSITSIKATLNGSGRSTPFALTRPRSRSQERGSLVTTRLETGWTGGCTTTIHNV